MSAITCRQMCELLLDYIAGELTPEQYEHVKKHLILCPPCVAYLETYQITLRLTRQLPPQPLPEQLVVRLKAALCDMEQGGQPPSA